MRARGFLLGGTAGPHDAQRRRPAARGRPQPHPRRARSRTASPTTRPSRYEVAVIVQRRPAAHVRGAGGRLLLHHADERELRASRACRTGAEAGIIKGMYLLPGRRQGANEGAPRVQLLGSGTILREVIAGGRAAGEGLRRRRRRLERARASPSCARDGDGCRALEPAASDRDAAQVPMSRPSLAGRAGPVDRRRPTTWSCSPTRSARSCRRPLQRARHRRLRPLATTASKLRELLRGRPPLHRGGGAEGAGRRGHGAGPRTSPRRSRKYGIDPEKARSLDRLTSRR